MAWIHKPIIKVFSAIIFLSVILYLWGITRFSEMEIKNQLAPKIAEHMKNIKMISHWSNKFQHRVWKHSVSLNIAELNYNINPLLKQLDDVIHWKFIKNRIQDNWQEYIKGIEYLQQHGLLPGYRIKKHVLVFPGVLSATQFAQTAFKGGPVGELVAWSDLIAALYILGHKLDAQYHPAYVDSMLMKGVRYLPTSVDGCFNHSLDLIYTDLLGHESLQDSTRKFYRNKFRILDNFGTEQAFNHERYIKQHAIKASSYGNRNLHLKQFYTYFPQTPDNSFLGFTMKNTTGKYHHLEKKNIAILYGKNVFDFQKCDRLAKVVPILEKYVEVHATLLYLPRNFSNFSVVNHGLLNSEAFQALSASAKLIVGIGKPEEGPGILEAIARGCVYINPTRRGTELKYSNKPTNRTISSQNGYAEKFIGPPYVYTVDFYNTTALENTIKTALHQKNQPMLPFELTAAGYLQRLHMFLQHQNWCDNTELWPPQKSISYKVNTELPMGASCNQVCESKDLICENMYFPSVNNEIIFNQFNFVCKSVVQVEELHVPAFEPRTSTCFLQRDVTLFSCASYLGEESDIWRICPCRDFIKHQVQLCKYCQ